MQRKQKRELKKNIKRIWVYLAIIFPIFLVVSYLLAVTNIPMALNIFVCVLIGLVLYFLFEFIYTMHIKRKQRKLEMMPKTKDPFAD